MTNILELEIALGDTAVTHDAGRRLRRLLVDLYCELDRDDYLDVLEYALGRIDLVDEDLGTIVAKIYRVAYDRD